MMNLPQQAVALLEVLSGKSSDRLNDSVDQAKQLVRGLIGCGAWQLGLDLLSVCRGALRTERERAEVELLRIECLFSLGKFQEALEVISLMERDPALLALPGYEAVQSEVAVFKGWGLWKTHRLSEARHTLNSAYAHLLQRPESSTLGWCACNLGCVAWTQGDLKSAKHHFVEALVSSVRVGNLLLEARAQRNLSILLKHDCRWHEAREHRERAMMLWGELENVSELVQGRLSQAIVDWKLGNLESSRIIALAAINDAIEFHDIEAECDLSELAALVETHAGQFDSARDRLGRALALWTGADTSRQTLLASEYLGDVYLEQGQAEQALKHYDEVWPKAMALVPKGDIVAELRRRRAECYLLLGRSDDAYAEAKAALEHCRELGDRYEEAATYRVLALGAAVVGKPSEAKQWFDQGFAFYDDIETPYEWGKLWMAYGDWLKGENAGEYKDLPGALEAYRAAEDHFERMGAEAKLAETRARMSSLPAFATAMIERDEETLVTDQRRPPRRPRGSSELDRRSAWALDRFRFVTHNKVVLDLLSEVAKLAESGTQMLILGESGTGKELVAEGIHKISGRTGRFVAINCGALPRDVVESELFGHVAGAFTGAIRDKVGLLESCAGGTLFLDEVGEMSLDLQTRLLRFLESGEVRRVGSTKSTIFDTQVVAATNRDRAALERGEAFRSDLYYRLAHAVVVLPPLRRRGDDIDLLVSHFLEEACAEFGRDVRITDAARNRLIAFAWPGNVRQLRSFMRRLVVLAPSGGVVSSDAIALEDSEGTGGGLTGELERTERRQIVEALEQARGVRTEAAKLLGMSRTTLLGKMKRYGIR
jgi:DNA-binding NtrC family response regulator/tetratricopeptide (TPR) repeat protein